MRENNYKRERRRRREKKRARDEQKREREKERESVLGDDSSARFGLLLFFSLFFPLLVMTTTEQ